MPCERIPTGLHQRAYGQKKIAVGEGFEPPIRSHVCRFSKAVPLTRLSHPTSLPATAATGFLTFEN